MKKNYTVNLKSKLIIISKKKKKKNKSLPEACATSIVRFTSSFVCGGDGLAKLKNPTAP
jgi:hypothetical protein